MPSADSCGDPHLDKQLEDFLPVGCGAEAVFNFSWEKEIVPDGSGDDDDEDEDFVTTIRTAVFPKRTTASPHRTTPSIKTTEVIYTPNKLAPRLPPRFTPSPEARHSSFQHLLRLHLSSFNQRLSMLESNTLDMKEGIRSLHGQQNHLSSQLKQLIALHSSVEKNKKVAELENSYTDMEDRLSRLEGRLEILIDGFTALAQEMNKIKRRHISRSTQEKKALPPLALPFYSTTQLPVKIKPTEQTLTVAKSIPTPGVPTIKPSTASQNSGSKRNSSTLAKPVVTRQPKTPVSTRLTVMTTLNKPFTPTSTTTSTLLTTTSPSTSKPNAKVKPEPKKTAGKKSAVTVKRVLRPVQTHPKQVKDATVTKLQLDPPSHNSRPPQPHKQAHKKVSKKDSAPPPVKDNGQRNKAFRSDAPEPKQNQQQPSKSTSPSSSMENKVNRRRKEVHKLVSSSDERKSFVKGTVSTTKPTKTTALKKKSSTPKAPTARTVKKKVKSSAVKRKSKPAPKPQHKQNQNPSVFDLLRLLQGDQKTSKQKTHQDAFLHVVLGRLAIPIKIIPDN